MKDLIIFRQARKMLSCVILAAFLAGLCGYGLAYATGDHKTRVITFLSSGTRTGTNQSTGFEVSAYEDALILVNVTGESGSSHMDILVETSNDNTNWYTHTTLKKINATGTYLKQISNFGKYVRLNYTISGISFTFAASGVFKN